MVSLRLAGPTTCVRCLTGEGRIPSQGATTVEEVWLRVTVESVTGFVVTLRESTEPAFEVKVNQFEAMYMRRMVGDEVDVRVMLCRDAHREIIGASLLMLARVNPKPVAP